MSLDAIHFCAALLIFVFPLRTGLPVAVTGASFPGMEKHSEKVGFCLGFLVVRQCQRRGLVVCRLAICRLGICRPGSCTKALKYILALVACRRELRHIKLL